MVKPRIMNGIISLTLLELFSRFTPILCNQFVGPKACSSNSNIEGYESTSVLQKDIDAEANLLLKKGKKLRDPPYLYILCPNTVFDLNADSPISPVLTHTFIICGQSGIITDSCVFDGGDMNF